MMSADIESMFYLQRDAIPWHNLGNALDNDAATDSEKVRKGSGLNWITDTKPLFTASGEQVSHRAVYRKDTNAILGIVGPKWQPLQNHVMIDWFLPFIEAEEATYHTGGSLCGGQKVWMLCELKRDPEIIVPGDEFTKFMLLSNSHDGKTAIRVGFTPIRVVCHNTLSMAHGSEVSKLLRVRHSLQAETNLERIRDTVDAWNAQFVATAEQYRYLTTKTINQNDVHKYIKTLLGVVDKSDDEIKTRQMNIINGIEHLIDQGLGQTNPKVHGTYYAMYQGYNEYLNHFYGRNNNNRLDSLWFGPNTTKNMNALQLALQMAG